MKRGAGEDMSRERKKNRKRRDEREIEERN